MAYEENNIELKYTLVPSHESVKHARQNRALSSERKGHKKDREKLAEVQRRLQEATRERDETKKELGVRLDELEDFLVRMERIHHSRARVSETEREVWVFKDGRRDHQLGKSGEIEELLNLLMMDVKTAPDPYKAAGGLLTVVTNLVAGFLREQEGAGG